MSNLPNLNFRASSFWKFCNNLRVDTKEFGIVPLGQRIYSGQRYLIERIEAGLQTGVHQFTVLKGRQMGISTVMLALDLYWASKYPGTQGSLVTNNEDNREMFRNTLTMYMEGLPNAYRVPKVRHNRVELTFANRSRFIYQVAGTGKNSGLGKGKALNYCHATEAGEYGDPEGLASLQASFAEKHPLRMYVFESTAQGFNMFYDMWEVAQRATTQEAIFLGWWRKDDYTVAEGSAIHKVYGYRGTSPYEKKMLRDVKKLYGAEITAGQLAWYRWKLNEEIQDESLMMQNFPWTADEAFVMSGQQMYSSDVLTRLMKTAKTAVEPEGFQFAFADAKRFEDTDVRACHRKNASLLVWERPEPGAIYVIGVDPAYGASPDNDRTSIEVYRCYTDKLVQVAEFCSPVCDAYQCAWISFYLAGAYGPATMARSMIILEVNGPGQWVKAEMDNIKRNVADAGGASRGIQDWMGAVRSFLYRRVDTSGKGFAYHWKTDNNSKERMFGAFNQALATGHLEIRSADMVAEMKSICREDGAITHGSHTHDDRVIASALCTVAWSDTLRVLASRAQQNYAQKAVSEEDTPMMTTTQHAIQGYLKRVGLGQ
jgi:hypothetical protein